MRGLFICPGVLTANARGFSLVELTAVIAVTVLIGSLGVSAYRTYVVRAQIAASVIGVAAIQERVVSAFKRSGSPPPDRLDADLSASATDEASEYVASVDIIDGRIEIRFGGGADEAIRGSVLSLTPFETADQEVVWACGNRRPGVGLQPLGLIGGVRHPTQILTTIDNRYLPPECR